MTDSKMAVVPARQSVGAMAAVSTLEEIKAIKNVINADLSDPQLRLVAAYAQKTGLDPISKQFYPLILDGKLTLITAIDGFRVVAERSGQYAGQGPYEYGDLCRCGVARYGAHPEWAEATVFRDGWDVPMVRRAYFHEFVPTPGQNWMPGDPFPNSYNRDKMWRKMARTMLGKCAEAQALRATFPNDLGQLYIAEEMDQAQSIDVTPDTTQALATGSPTSTPSPAADDAPVATADTSEPDVPHRGGVFKVDGPRSIKAPDYRPDAGEPTTKYTVSFKKGRGKVHALLFGELAQAAAELEIVASDDGGDTIACNGEIKKITWSDDPKMPKKSEIHDVTELWLMRGGEWQQVGAPVPTPAPQQAQPSDEPGPKPPSDSSTDSEPPTPAPSAPPSSESETAKGEPEGLMDAASAIFDGADADVDPGRGGSTDAAALVGEVIEPEAPPEPDFDVSKAMKLAVWFNDDGKPMDESAIVLSVKRDKTGAGKDYAHIWFQHPKDPVRYQGVMSEDEALAQKVYDLVPGLVVRIIGTWKRANANAVVVMLTAVVTETS